MALKLVSLSKISNAVFNWIRMIGTAFKEEPKGIVASSIEI